MEYRPKGIQTVNINTASISSTASRSVLSNFSGMCGVSVRWTYGPHFRTPPDFFQFFMKYKFIIAETFVRGSFLVCTIIP